MLIIFYLQFVYLQFPMNLSDICKRFQLYFCIIFLSMPSTLFYSFLLQLQRFLCPASDSDPLSEDVILLPPSMRVRAIKAVYSFSKGTNGPTFVQRILTGVFTFEEAMEATLKGQKKRRINAENGETQKMEKRALKMKRKHQNVWILTKLMESWVSIYCLNIYTYMYIYIYISDISL